MRESAKERAAWTEFVTGVAGKKPSKYGNERGEYDSKRESIVAASFQALAKSGKITEYQEQVKLVLVEGRDGVRPITYICDFRYRDEDGVHWLDAKGCRTAVYLLKKKLAFLLHGIRIEEV